MGPPVVLSQQTLQGLHDMPPLCGRVLCGVRASPGVWLGPAGRHGVAAVLGRPQGLACRQSRYVICVALFAAWADRPAARSVAAMPSRPAVQVVLGPVSRCGLAEAAGAPTPTARARATEATADSERLGEVGVHMGISCWMCAIWTSTRLLLRAVA